MAKGDGAETSTKAYIPSVTSVTVILPSSLVASVPMICPSSRILNTAPGRGLLESSSFHDLRHVFATNALEHGMDVKTLSTVIGHVSSATTLNVYAHVTDDMQRQAAAKIDRGIGKVEIPIENPQAVASRTMTDFKPKRGKRRYWGSGYLGQTKGGRWNGRYTVTWPDGTKRTRDIYADTAEECEKLLAVMITEMKTEVAAEKERLRAENRAS